MKDLEVAVPAYVVGECPYCEEDFEVMIMRLSKGVMN